MRRLPPLHALRAFEAAARHSSVTAAAEELRVSHSAISQQIKTLEEYFGQKLFARKGRRISPTSAARVFLSDVKTALDLIAIGSERFVIRPSEVQLSINTTPSFALRWLIPKTSQYQLDNPTVRVVVQTSATDSIEALDQPYDFVVRRFPMQKPGYKCGLLVDDVSTPLVSPSFLAAHPINTADDLTSATLLQMKSRPDAWQNWFAQHAGPGSGVVKGPFLDHFFLSLQSAISGLGVALGPLCLVEDDLAARRLVAPLPHHTLSGPGFHILVRDDGAPTRHRRSFLAALYEASGRRLQSAFA